MSEAIKTRLVKIGNSQGIRIPKLLLEQSGIRDDVEIQVYEGQLIIRPVKSVREGWEDAFQTMHDNRDDALVDEVTETLWESDEWEWQ
ncbi:AbrB/MazE/SpoVT family DNA-binding domain-containing protein [[Limnothrix rosea] IAM M-220]|uniref:AbrB/MazE/SpoVT family DNA-binding domain-containing protein n=1 Tax=[Limnothrix rosea] IAM M-220 TaxID=454133 RepID=UPI000969B659|nr:AbrB/MazE/SpoVT family DNA-binding domain-containing protein [[Limnothrix rosea] IAM M-220]OKH17227.1 MazE family transcriptional regulator [[Limnothrix rosea] IAM M-220]